jgi:glycosyltransferase involved in cell wall biosynthesis
VNKKIEELSIFFPFWNEEKNIESVVKKAKAIVKEKAQNWEILMVDDGSSDKTLSVCKKLALTDPKHLRVISHQPNRGYGAALREGFENANYDYVVFNDGDGQFDFSEIDKFIRKIKNADIVVGFRRKRRDHPIRRVLMWLLKIWDFIFFGFYFKDIDCGFKLFRKSAVLTISPLKSEGAMITTEILAKARKAKLKIAEVEVRHYPRIYGDQSGGNLRVILRAIKESIMLWFELHYARN